MEMHGKKETWRETTHYHGYMAQLSHDGYSGTTGFSEAVLLDTQALFNIHLS